MGISLPTRRSVPTAVACSVQVRQQLAAALAAGRCSMQGIYLALEHDRMHQETLCYMLAQQQKRAWQQAHLLDNGSVLENGLAFRESLARVSCRWPDLWTAPCSYRLDPGSTWCMS